MARYEIKIVAILPICCDRSVFARNRITSCHGNSRCACRMFLEIDEACASTYLQEYNFNFPRAKLADD